MRVGLGAVSALLALLVAPPLAADAASAARDAERAKAGPRMAGQHPAYLPDASCGFVDTAADDAAHAFQPAGTPVSRSSTRTPPTRRTRRPPTTRASRRRCAT